MEIRLLALFSLLATLLWSPAAFACKCDKSIKPISGSEIVFWGKANEIKSRGAQDRVEFEISQLYKGDEERPVVMVYTNRFHHDCGLRLEEGKTYMVYAYDFYPRGVATSMCWGTYEAEEPVAEDKWKDLKLDIPDDTKLEEDLRKIAKKAVPRCGAEQRLFDAGFSFILSPDGDPVLFHDGKKPNDKLRDFRQCVLDKFVGEDDLPQTDKPTLIHGWFQRDVRAQPVLLDELPCGETCPDFGTLLRTALMRAEPEETSDQSIRNLRMEREECIKGGHEAVGTESPGTTAQKMRRGRMLAECAVRRGEFDQAGAFLENIENETLRQVLEWTIAQGNTEFPVGDSKSFPSYALEGKVSTQRLRQLRQSFVQNTSWVDEPYYLEAFAQTILVDDKATDGMKALAALALQRAAQIAPKFKDGYEKLANDVDSKGASELRDQLKAALAPPAPEPEPVAEEAPAVAEEAAEAVAAAPAEEGKDPMILVVAGVLIAVAIGGIGAILKRRR